MEGVREIGACIGGCRHVVVVGVEGSVVRPKTLLTQALSTPGPDSGQAMGGIVCLVETLLYIGMSTLLTQALSTA